MLHSRLRLSGPLAQMTADRFELLLSQRLILRDLDGFIDAAYPPYPWPPDG